MACLSNFEGTKENSTGTCLIDDNSLNKHCVGVDAVLSQEETVHVTSRKEGIEGRIAGSRVCEETSVVCGVTIMGVWLDPAGLFWHAEDHHYVVRCRLRGTCRHPHLTW